jgi:quinoprotein glucose dehydrogenase
MIGRCLASAAMAALLVSAPSSGLAADTAKGDWPNYGGDAAGTRFSPLKQITPQNVTQLKPAWRFDTAAGGIQTQPVVVEGVVYVISPDNKVIALDGVTGQPKWEFASGLTGRQPSRGVTWWEQGRERRILVGLQNWLYALDPATGQPIPTFGTNGRIDLRENLRGTAEENDVFLTTPGQVYKDMIVVGGRVSESEPASPGDIRAFDVRTGKLRWTFRTIPAPGEFGADTWPADAREKLGGANNWAGLIIDQKRGVVFAPTGSPSDDFYGGGRPGANLFGNTMLALDANTGKRIWHFQAVQHDTLDADFGSPPNLVTVNRGGKKVDAVVATNKMGMIYMFDRATGENMFPYERVPVPASTVPGEQSWPTQIMPLLPQPLSRVRITAETLTNRSAEANKWAREEFKKFASGEFFAPLEVGKQVAVSPAYGGGTEWGGAAVDPRTSVLYVNSNNVAYNSSLRPRPAAAAAGAAGVPAAQGGEVNAARPRSPYVFAGYTRWLDPDGYPAVATPWGTLNAIDMNTGAYLWRIPFGEYPELVEQGIKDTGTESYGAPVVTATGLLFIGATIYDRKIRAYDSATGKLLWEDALPFPGTASPAVYQAGGRQFIVIGTSSARNRKFGQGAAYVAYALPQ